jgi:transcriptional regulator with XRE-family HTH domain
MNNRIRSLREKRNLSQADLAQLAGTSQQQIQRFESGAQSVKLDVAARICVALETDLASVFPETAAVLTKSKAKTTADMLRLADDEQKVADLDAGGLDVDPVTWLLALRMRGGAKLTLPVSTADRYRLRRNIEDSRLHAFFVCNSRSVSTAVNLNHLVHYHELFDPGHLDGDWEDQKVDREDVTIYLADSDQPLKFSVEPDEPESSDDVGQMRHFLFMAETDVGEGEYLHFIDADGETAFFRASDVALVTVPLRVIDDAVREDEEAEQEALENDVTD